MLIFSRVLCVCVNLATTTATTTQPNHQATHRHLLRSAATTQVGGKGDRHGVVGRIHSGFSQLDFLGVPTLRMTSHRLGGHLSACDRYVHVYIYIYHIYIIYRYISIDDLDSYRCHVIVQETGVKNRKKGLKRCPVSDLFTQQQQQVSCSWILHIWHVF